MALAAADAPERVDRLVLCCTSARLGPPEMWEERIATVAAPAAPAPSPTPRSGAGSRPRADPDTVAALRRDAARQSRARGYAACCAAIRDMDLRERLPLDRGAHARDRRAPSDPATPPEHADVIAAGIPGARQLRRSPDAAHLANVEHAEEVTAAMLEHLP